MKRLEKILIALCIILFVLKLVPVLGVSLFLTIFALTLSLLYLVFGVLFFNGIKARNIIKPATYAHLSAGNIIVALFAGITFSCSILGMLFMVNGWPGAQVINFYPPILLIILLVTTIIFYKKSPEVSSRILYRMIPIMLVYSILFYRLINFGLENYNSLN